MTSKKYFGIITLAVIIALAVLLLQNNSSDNSTTDVNRILVHPTAYENKFITTEGLVAAGGIEPPSIGGQSYILYLFPLNANTSAVEYESYKHSVKLYYNGSYYPRCIDFSSGEHPERGVLCQGPFDLGENYNAGKKYQITGILYLIPAETGSGKRINLIALNISSSKELP